MYVVGGNPEPAAGTTVQTYDTTASTWSLMPSMPVAMSTHSAVASTSQVSMQYCEVARIHSDAVELFAVYVAFCAGRAGIE